MNILIRCHFDPQPTRRFPLPVTAPTGEYNGRSGLPPTATRGLGSISIPPFSSIAYSSTHRAFGGRPRPFEYRGTIDGTQMTTSARNDIDDERGRYRVIRYRENGSDLTVIQDSQNDGAWIQTDAAVTVRE